jgi:hypothetical protein
VPFFEHAWTIGQMVYRIDTGDGIEAAILERQPPGRITTIEIGALLAPHFLRARDALVVQIDARDTAAGLLCDPQRRPARSACHIEQVTGSRQSQPGNEKVLLFGGQPARLTDIVAERLATDVRVERARKVSIAGAVEIDSAAGRHRPYPDPLRTAPQGSYSAFKHAAPWPASGSRTDIDRQGTLFRSTGWPRPTRELLKLAGLRS